MRRVVRVAAPEMFWHGGSLRCSAEASFRELDDVFLQNQTRMWLDEILQMRLNEEMAIADLISDGELLFQVSKVVWKMLLKKQVDLKDSKLLIYERTSSGKSNGRYLAYPKVDSFLKICQILGLTGIDLFSPSDVVEKRNARKVCMCIRSLAKKARSKNLDVPDFDNVTYTIAMPSDLVDGIRRNLERSQYSSSSSSSYRQKLEWSDSYSESDEAENTCVELELQSSPSNLSTIDGDISSNGNSVFDGNLSELQQVLFGSPSHSKLPLPCGEYQINASEAEAEADSDYCSHNKFFHSKIDSFRIDRDNEAHELEIGRLRTPNDSNKVCTDDSNVPDGTKSLIIHNINPEALCHWASDTRGEEKDNDLHEPKMESVSTSNSSGEEEEGAAGGLRRSVNTVLKSVAGGITVVGVMFLLLQLRQRKGQEKNIKPTMPLQTPRLSTRDRSSQKRAEIGNTFDRVYPGDRLKF